MRKSLFFCALMAAVFAIAMPQKQAKADGFVAGAAVGFIGGAMIGAHASPYYYSGYGYAPAYYQPAPVYVAPRPVYAVPAYSYAPTYPSYYSGTPYMVTSRCWSRRTPVYDRFGDVIAVRGEHNCR